MHRRKRLLSVTLASLVHADCIVLALPAALKERATLIIAMPSSVSLATAASPGDSSGHDMVSALAISSLKDASSHTSP